MGEVPNSMNAVDEPQEFEEEWPIELNQTEALKGFAIYLTQNEQHVVGSAGINVAVMVEMLRGYCEANGFEGVRKDWKDSLMFPE